MNEKQIKRITALGVKLMNIHVRMRRHHYGWLVTYPCEFVEWDYRTYCEKYFESYPNGESGYRQAQRFVRETKEKIEEAQQRDADEETDRDFETSEWFKGKCFQIGYHRLPSEDRRTPEDHMPELDFDIDFDRCLDHIKQLRAKGYYDISLDELQDGSSVESICIGWYVDDWEMQA